MEEQDKVFEPMLMDLLFKIKRLLEDMMVDSRLGALDTLLAALNHYTSFEDGVLDRVGIAVSEFNRMLVDLTDIFSLLVSVYASGVNRLEQVLGENPEYANVMEAVRRVLDGMDVMREVSEDLDVAKSSLSDAVESSQVLFAGAPDFYGLLEEVDDGDDESDDGNASV